MGAYTQETLKATVPHLLSRLKVCRDGAPLCFVQFYVAVLRVSALRCQQLSQWNYTQQARHHTEQARTNHTAYIDNPPVNTYALALAVEQVLRGVSTKRLLDFKCHHSQVYRGGYSPADRRDIEQGLHR